MHSTAVCLIVLASILTGHCASWYGHSTSNRHVIKSKISQIIDCKNQMCQTVEEYPEEEINDAMEDEHLLKSLLGGSVFNATADVITIGNRMGQVDETTSTQLCNTERAMTYRPRLMRTISGNVKYIVNTERYRQTVTVEACRKVAEPDITIDTTTECWTNFRMQCHQNYQNLSLVTFEEGVGSEQGKIQFDIFSVPITCKCCGG